MKRSTMTSKAKISFYNERRRSGDNARVAKMTSYSVPHVINVREGRRTNDEIANAFYSISRRRQKNLEKFN